MAEMIKTSKKLCESCEYSKVFITKSDPRMCDYLGMTYMRRGCPVGWCDKYKKKES